MKIMKIYSNIVPEDRVREVQKETFSTVGFPPEISTMSIEEAAIFLKDRVDIAGEDLAFELNDENIEKFKNNKEGYQDKKNNKKS